MLREKGITTSIDIVSKMLVYIKSIYGKSKSMTRIRLETPIPSSADDLINKNS